MLSIAVTCIINSHLKSDVIELVVWPLIGDKHIHFSNSAPEVYIAFGMGIVSSEKRSGFRSANEGEKSILVKSGKW
jgi:hypothetical protein